ncbi:MAG: hypothetical protein LBR17_01525 [Bacteroidales bacterium]|jgi:hypothetical protein|nr:hypothetical protein [Bacteroidales bacterium]
MSRKFMFIAAIAMMIAAMPMKAQKTHAISLKHLTMEMPNDNNWGQIATDADKIQLGTYLETGVKKVVVTCYFEVKEIVALITNLASEKSLQQGFEYMSIEQVKDAKIAKEKAKLLAYSNTYLNETFIGGFYGFVKEGYTYVIEYYGEDNPSDKDLIKKILESIRIEKPVKIDPTIVEKDEHFAPKEAKTQEELDKQTEKVAKEQKKAEKEQKKLEKQTKEAEKQKQKAIKEQKKAQKQQEKEIKKQKEETKKALKEKEKKIEEQNKALKAEKKAAKEKEKQLEQQKKDAKKAAKEQLKALEQQEDAIDQQEKVLKEQQKTIKDPTKEQKKQWKETEKQIKEKRKALKEQKNRLN